ncbi:cofilin/actin-depolymerizing factor homolog, partial [Sitodiplosis mosellana]|uniref:cofilin/actin-depolymerizing factor homolog n=1 Tax=Sitodiplosis mosellana TaxID=263140 RepID=UPI0024448AEB
MTFDNFNLQSLKAVIDDNNQKLTAVMTVSNACKTTYEEIEKYKKHRYVIFYIKNYNQIDVESVGGCNAEYKQFLEAIQKGGTRKGVKRTDCPSFYRATDLSQASKEAVEKKLRDFDQQQLNKNGLLSWAGKSIEPYGIDYILNK